MVERAFDVSEEDGEEVETQIEELFQVAGAVRSMVDEEHPRGSSRPRISRWDGCLLRPALAQSDRWIAGAELAVHSFQTSIQHILEFCYRVSLSSSLQKFCLRLSRARTSFTETRLPLLPLDPPRLISSWVPVHSLYHVSRL